MELILFILAVLATGSLTYFILMGLYFGFTRRPVGLALKLSWMLTIISIVGVVLIGIGGVILSSLILNGAMTKRPNYSQTRDIVAAIIIALVGSVAIYFASFSLAFAILD